MKHIKCMICQHDNADVIIDRTFPRHVICRNCGFVYMNPIKPFDEVIDYYENNYWEYRNEHWNDVTKINIANIKVTSRVKAIHQWLKPKLNEEAEVLEIGAGFGHNVAYIKSQVDCNVEAIEPSRAGVDFMAKEFGIKGICTSLEKYQTDKKYDVIILSHVLEHFEDPQNALKICHQLLKEDGWLWIEVPNIMNPNPAKDLNKWFSKEHVSYFSLDKLKYLMELENLNIIREEEDVYVRVMSQRSSSPLSPSFVNENNAVRNSIARQKKKYFWRQKRNYLSQIKNKIFK